jgi:hypothetical protein
MIKLWIVDLLIDVLGWLGARGDGLVRWRNDRYFELFKQ